MHSLDLQSIFYWLSDQMPKKLITIYMSTLKDKMYNKAMCEYNVQCWWCWCCYWELKKNLLGEWSTLHVTTTGNSKTIYWKISVRPPFLSLCDSYHHVYLWKQYDAIFRNIVIASVAYYNIATTKSAQIVWESERWCCIHSFFVSLPLLFTPLAHKKGWWWCWCWWYGMIIFK